MGQVVITSETVRRAKIILARRAQKRGYQVDPTKWLTEKFGGKRTDFIWSEFPEYANHKWDGTPDPFFTAVEAIRTGQDVGIEAGTGVGKSYCASKIAFWFLDSFPNAAVITTSPTKAQLLNVLWKEIGRDFPKFKKGKPNAVLLTGEVRVNDTDQYDDESTDVVFSNRMISRVGRKKAGEESSVSFQGIHEKYQLFILDEAAGLEHSVITAIKNTNTFKGQEGAINAILALGNPDSVTDGLHVFCLSPGVKHVVVSAYDHPNVVIGKALIPGAVTRESIAIRRQEYGEESNLYRSRVRGIAPEQSTDALIMAKWLRALCRFTPDFKRELVKDDPYSFSAVGVDVANSVNGDAACLAWGKHNRLVEVHEFQCPNANDLADNLLKDENMLIMEGINNYGTKTIHNFGITGDHIGVDAAGVGVATVNQFSKLGLTVLALSGGVDELAIPVDAEGKPLYKFANLRAQMWFQFRIDCQKMDFSIDILDYRILNQLIKELTTVRYKVTDGHILIEKKDDIKERLGGKSPNMADAIVYWNWARKKRSGSFVMETPVGYAQTDLSKPDQQDTPEIWRSEAKGIDQESDRDRGYR